jgi:hypothetical protein
MLTVGIVTPIFVVATNKSPPTNEKNEHAIMAMLTCHNN